MVDVEMRILLLPIKAPKVFWDCGKHGFRLFEPDKLTSKINCFYSFKCAG